jgi:hypothetical protein
MKKAIKYLIVIIVLSCCGLFAYDYYMTNSGVKNRIDYEIQKNDVKNTGKDRPVRDFIRDKLNR